MKKTRRAFMLFAALGFAALSLSTPLRPVKAQRNGGGGGSSPITYPETKKVDVVDDYFGTKVADPYRWLEDNDSPEVAAWVEAENKVTFAYLDQISYRAQLKDRLMKLFNYAKFGSPQRRGDQFMSWKNDGLQNQNIYYIQKGLDGTPEVLLEPNKFSADGTSRLGAGPTWSPKGKYILYGISQGGSDWNDLYVMDVATRKPLDDHLKWIKNGGGSWRGDEGFFYSRYPEPEKGRELYSKNEFQSVWYHKIGTPQTDDELIYEDKANPQRFQNVNVTEDGRFAFLYVSERGKGKDGNALSFRDLSKSDKTFTPIISDIGNDGYSVRDDINGKFLIETNHGAPNGKLVLYDPAAKTWTDIIPEKSEPLESSGTAGGKIFVTYLKDVTTRAYVYSLNGKLENEIQFPGLGTAGGFGGRDDDKFVFYSFTSFNTPPTLYKYDIATRKSAVFRTVDIPGFNANDYDVKEVFYNSKDGTRVPLFLTYKKGIKLDGNNPTLLYGYGGFNIVTNPSFSALRIALLEQGFVYASANMRGGGEYGEKWHEAGTKLKKQNVFDDFIAAAEYLISQKYTSSARLAIDGASNGGLLVGAVANQRPDLFRAVHQHAGVMDMLRYQKFTIGWNWAADYGRSDANEAEFKALYAYSPIHNVKPGTRYPSILVTTADHDDRVVPAHSFKYAAALQAAQSGDNPVIIRIDTKSGHGASSTTKQLEQTADIYSFIMYNLGVTPKW
ncbi:MAG TPA: prolyl oligopeptidase family serine peptidase [Pyrinomonadaceae bacterium]|nr:prolyl oligopeptidase family serine peptidase [Pyrinomonadaceae bacterium]